jgi:hypothetical protein
VHDRRHVLPVLLAAAAVAIGGFFLLRPSDDDGAGAAPAAAPVTQTTAPEATATTEREAPVARPAVPKATQIRIRDGEPAGGVAEIEVDRGQTIRMDISADAPDEVHVHGFDIMRPVAPGAPAKLRFKADIEGRFDVESHITYTQLARITVNP